MTILRLVKLAMMLCTGCRATWDASSDAGTVPCSSADNATCNGGSSEAKVQAESDGHDLASMLQSGLEMARLPSAKQADPLVECCNMVTQFNLEPHVTWGATNTNQRSWWTENNCNSVVGQQGAPNCQQHNSATTASGEETQPEASTFTPGPENMNFCPAGTVAVASEGSCREAASALGFVFWGPTPDSIPDSELPKGCFIFTYSSFDADTGTQVPVTMTAFNRHDTGRGLHGFTPICQEAPCQSKSDCPDDGTGFVCVNNLCQASTFYIKGSMDSYSCPPSAVELDSEEDCSNAASALGAAMQPTQASENLPRGCSGFDELSYGVVKTYVFFNPHDPVGSFDDRFPLCKEVECKGGSDCPFTGQNNTCVNHTCHAACSNFHGVCDAWEHKRVGEDACRGGVCDKEGCCEANTCTCSGGDPAHGPACWTNNGAYCASCYDGFHLFLWACLVNECTCVNGRAATGAACTSNGGAICERCNSGFILESGACEASPYRHGPVGGNLCPAGTIAVASEENCMQAAPALGGHFVQTINIDNREFYPQGCFTAGSLNFVPLMYFNPHDTGADYPGATPICQDAHCQSESDCPNGGTGYTCGVDNLCQANVCTCVDGLAATGPACTSQGGVICESCDLGFILEGIACEASIYKFGLINSNSCPVGTAPIASEGDCMEAASLFHVIYNWELPAVHQMNYPKGCFQQDWTSFGGPPILLSFNPHDTGSSQEFSTPLCKDMPCQSESDCPHGGTGYTCMDSLCQATCASFSASSCLSNSLVDNAASTICTDASCSSPANDNLCCKATCGSYDCAQNGFISMDDPDSIVCTDSTCSRPANDHVCCKATCSSYDTSQCAQNGLVGVDDPSGTVCTDLICSSPANDNVCCKACYKPNGCSYFLDEYLNVDCDGDGLLDHMCTYHHTGNMRLVLTTEGCPQIHPDGGGSWGPVRQASECCVWVEHEGVEAVASSGLSINPGTTKYDFEEAKARCLERGQTWCKAVTCETVPLPSYMGGGTKCTLRATTTMVTPSSSSPFFTKTYVPTAGCLP